MKLLNAVTLLLAESITAQQIPATTSSDYQNNLSQTALNAQNNCQQNDQGNSEIQRGQQQPSCFQGYDINTSFGFIYANSNNIGQISSINCSGNSASPSSWCPLDGSQRRQCSVKGSQIGSTDQINISQQCMIMNQCDQFTYDAAQSKWVYNACPNLQCPKYLYRQGTENSSGQNMERRRGKFVFRRNNCSASNNRSSYSQNCDVLKSWQESSDANWNFAGHTKSLAPFQCVHDDCDSKWGAYIRSGNTDTGPTSHLGGISRVTINPYWTQGITSTDKVASQEQGRCGTCLSYESTTDAQNILSYSWNQYDPQTGQLINGQQPTIVGNGQLGCQRCAQYQKRDSNTGQCRVHTCTGNTILNRGGNQQGECSPCTGNSVADSLNRTCQPCQSGRTAQQRTNGEWYCGVQSCNSRSFLNRAGTCQQCLDYQVPPPAGSGQDRCVTPVCYNQVVERDGTCRTCSPGTTPDAQQRNCLSNTPAPCPDWQRRQDFNQQCASDQCQQGYRLVQNGFDQGRCTPCAAGEDSSSDYRSCVARQVTCPWYQAQDSSGRCYDCQPGETVSYADQFGVRTCQAPVVVECQDYTRRQLNGNCEPNQCTQYERNARIDTVVNGQSVQRGFCIRCDAQQISSSPDPLYSNARTSCQTQACASNEIRNSAGQCQACQQCEDPDQTKTYCVPVTCFDRQYKSIFQNSGFGGIDSCRCTTCPDYELPNTDGRSCSRASCPNDSYLTVQGSCQQCPGYPRSTQAPGGVSCQDKQCGLGQYLDINAQCTSCPAYQTLNYERTGCVSPQCGDRQIVLSDGSFEECQAYTRTIRTNTAQQCRTCGPDICNSNQYLGSDGRCYDCGEYLIPDVRNNNRDRCVTPTCPQNSIVNRQGQCQACQSGFNPDQTQRNCIEVRCGFRQRLITEGSTTRCEECPIRTRAQQENTICAADPCDYTLNQITLDDGSCYKCGLFLTLNADRTQCVDPVCNDNQIVKQDGTCENCPQYFRRVEYNQGFGGQAQCVECACNSQFGRDYCLPSGQCATCGDYLVPTPDGRGCARPNCPQVVNKDGTCGSCDDYQYWDDEAEPAQCKDRVCPARERVLRNGQCEACPAYFFLTTNGRECSRCDCGPRDICQGDGSCKACADFQIVQTTGEEAGKVCVRPECLNAVLQRDGTCKPCGDCEKINSSKTACVKPTCNARSVLQYDGKCTECPEFQGPALNDGDQCGARCEACTPTGRDYLLADGKCKECPDYFLIGDDRRTCEPVVCTGNQYVTLDGRCRECQDYTRVDAARRKCVASDCLANQILKVDGSCETCPKYFSADDDARVCIQQPCTERGYYDETGTCLECPGCTRSTEPRIECFADTCTARDILLNDGRCSKCPAYQKPTKAIGTCGDACEEVECESDEILLEDGTCDRCPDWTQPMARGRVCGPDVCEAREKLVISGNCVECDDYTRAADSKPQGVSTMQKQQYTDCLPDQCEANQILTKAGTCAFCAPYEKADLVQRSCAVPACGDRTSKLLQDATFEKCPEYTRAAEDCKTCRPEPCSLREKLLPNGTCEECPDYMRASPDGRECRKYTCETNQILLTDGTCQQCPPFQKSSPDGLTCVKVVCGQRQRLLPSGVCEDCEAYSRAINDGKACAPNLCTQRQKLLQDGTCEDCGEYTRAFANGRECASSVCTARQILQKDGRCAECYPYTRADAEGKGCVPHNCNDRQMLGQSGTCLDCPDFERAQGTGLTCGPDTCNVRQRVLQDGTCKYCPLYQSVSANRQRCNKPTCKPKVEYIHKDGVCQQCAFHQQTGPDGTTCETDPTKKLPDPQVIAPTPVTLQASPSMEMQPATCTTTGCDVWTDEQFLSQDQATGFYLNQSTGNLGFILGNAVRLSSAVAALSTAVLIALNAL